MVFFVAHFLSSISKHAGKVRVDRSVRRNKFTLNTHLRLEKTMSMLFVELQNCCAFFALGDCGLFHCNNCCFIFGS
jgi:hypothetical protein